LGLWKKEEESILLMDMIALALYIDLFFLFLFLFFGGGGDELCGSGCFKIKFYAEN